MSLAEIEAELGKLTPQELRQLALKSWSAFVEKESRPDGAHQCSEDDPELLAALDDTIERVDATPQQGCSGSEARSRLGKWTSR